MEILSSLSQSESVVSWYVRFDYILKLRFFLNIQHDPRAKKIKNEILNSLLCRTTIVFLEKKIYLQKNPIICCIIFFYNKKVPDKDKKISQKLPNSMYMYGYIWSILSVIWIYVTVLKPCLTLSNSFFFSLPLSRLKIKDDLYPRYLSIKIKRVTWNSLYVFQKSCWSTCFTTLHPLIALIAPFSQLSCVCKLQ